MLLARQGTFHLCKHGAAVLQQLLPASFVLAAEQHTAALPGGTGSSTSMGGKTAWWSAAAGALAAAAAAAGTATAYAESGKSSRTELAAAQQQDQQQQEAGDGVSAAGKLLSLPMRQRIFFKYEKRIRDLSTLEKIYEYFATHEKDGRKVMTAQDVVRALVPTYPPSDSTVERAGFLDGERGHSRAVQSAHESILYFFDQNKDGMIGFNEFVLIVIAMAVPEKDAEVVFDVIDLDNNGVLDEDEFSQVLKQLERRAGIQPKFVGRVGKHAVQPDDQQVTHQLFAHEGNGGVSLSRFRAFLDKLQEGMLQLEFAHYDTQGVGRIKGVDFANSLVTAADIKVVDQYLDKVQALPPALAQANVSLRDFNAVAQLRRNMHMLSFALDFCSQVERPLSKTDFSKLLQKTLQVELAPAVLDILFHVFGGADGLLDGGALVQVMKARNRVPGYRKGQGLGVATEGADSSSAVLNWWNCVRNCTFLPSSHEPLAAPH